MKDHEYKYTQIYLHFKKLIEEGEILKGEKMPSLLACSQTFSVSKTTAENAYFQLAADGYILSRERSGYYVTGRRTDLGTDDGDEEKSRQQKKEEASYATGAVSLSLYETCGPAEAVYDMANMGDDPQTFRFDLWQRYLKSAIRHKDRMVTYGEPQGEEELREAICEYVRKRRHIFCSPESIVIGASTQSLLMILLPVLKKKGARTASVPAKGFERYAQVFDSHDLKVDIRRKEADLIYVSPSHMTVWGDVMALSRRYEILEHSKKGHLIIEDDYQNEFVFSKQGCPSIYALAGGENVVYLGSFSRLLLPSIRISFMILPREILPAYQAIADRYDQTASKIEQLALCSYLRDEHLYRQIKKLRKTYAAKRTMLDAILHTLTADIPGLTVQRGDGGTEMAVHGETEKIQQFRERLDGWNISYRKMKGYSDENEQMLLFSCALIESETLKELEQTANPASRTRVCFKNADIQRTQEKAPEAVR